MPSSMKTELQIPTRKLKEVASFSKRVCRAALELIPNESESQNSEASGGDKDAEVFEDGSTSRRRTKGLLLGGLVGALVQLSEPKKAVELARGYGFTVNPTVLPFEMEKIQNNTGAEGAGNSSGAEGPGESWIQRIKGNGIWRGIARVVRSVRRIYAKRPVIVLPDGAELYANQLARAAALICLERYNETTGRRGLSFSDETGSLALLRSCIHTARTIHAEGSLRAEAAFHYRLGNQGEFLRLTDELLEVRPRWLSWTGIEEGYSARHTLNARGAALLLFRMLITGIETLLRVSWSKERLLRAAVNPNNSIFMKYRIKVLLSLGDVTGANLTAAAMRSHDFTGLGREYEFQTDLAARAFQAIRRAQKEANPKPIVRSVLRELDSQQAKWTRASPEVKSFFLALRSKGETLMGSSCWESANAAKDSMQNMFTLELLGDCGHADRANQGSGFAIAAYFASIVSAAQNGFPSDTWQKAAYIFFVKIMARGLYTRGSEIWENSAFYIDLIQRHARTKSEAFYKACSHAYNVLKKMWEEHQQSQKQSRTSGGGGKQQRSWGFGSQSRDKADKDSRANTGDKKSKWSWGSKQGRCERPFQSVSDSEVVRIFGGDSALGLHRCSKSGVRKAFHKLSLEHHPDKARAHGKPVKCAESNFIDLQAAYERAKELC
mmetsp:Transcript_42062/g.65774  ORF Transcript_42062/g.65774 Transcript_42062/m.65774 type:complete len:665 (+) Transcript_42062:488-2482(+)